MHIERRGTMATYFVVEHANEKKRSRDDRAMVNDGGRNQINSF